MSRMSGILILSYRLKEVTNSYVLPCFELQRIVHISATRCPTEMGFGSQCRILNGQVIYVQKSKLNIADMWLIPLDRVTYICTLRVLFMIKKVCPVGFQLFLTPKLTNAKIWKKLSILWYTKFQLITVKYHDEVEALFW